MSKHSRRRKTQKVKRRQCCRKSKKNYYGGMDYQGQEAFAELYPIEDTIIVSQLSNRPFVEFVNQFVESTGNDLSDENVKDMFRQLELNGLINIDNILKNIKNKDIKPDVLRFLQVLKKNARGWPYHKITVEQANRLNPYLYAILMYYTPVEKIPEIDNYFKDLFESNKTFTMEDFNRKIIGFEPITASNSFEVVKPLPPRETLSVKSVKASMPIVTKIKKTQDPLKKAMKKYAEDNNKKVEELTENDKLEVRRFLVNKKNNDLLKLLRPK